MMLRLFPGLPGLLGALFLLLHLSLSVQGSGAGGVYSIYTVSPFAITIVSQTSPDDLQLFASQLQQTTQEYFIDYFQASSELRESVQDLSTLHEVELQVSSRIVSSSSSSNNNNYVIYSELYGNIAFEEPPTGDPRPSNDAVHVMLEKWIRGALDVSTALPLYRQRLILTDSIVLQAMQSITIQFDIDPTHSPPPILVQPANTLTSNQRSSSDWSTAEYALLGTLILFLSTSILALVAFFKAERYKYRRDLAYERHHQYQNGEAYTDSYYTGTPEGHEDLIPTMTPSGQRRYVQSTSNNNSKHAEKSKNEELLYGASHLHSERHAVQQSQHQASSSSLFSWSAGQLPKQQRSSRNPAKQRNKNHHQQYSKTTNRPLMTLPEESSVAHWIKSSVMCVFSSGEKEDFVYCDFPRHDGTPCLMYNPKPTGAAAANATTASSSTNRNHNNYNNDNSDDDGDDDGEEQIIFSMDLLKSSSSPSSLALHQDEGMMLNHSQHSTNTAGSVSSTKSLEVFIDRLEQLYTLKQRQYEQRREMELERQAWKRKRHELAKSKKLSASALKLGIDATTKSALDAHSSKLHLITPTSRRDDIHDTSVDDGGGACNTTVDSWREVV